MFWQSLYISGVKTVIKTIIPNKLKQIMISRLVTVLMIARETGVAKLEAKFSNIEASSLILPLKETEAADLTV
ncbi:MAG: hypothetical protein QXM00_11710 [Candidatus Bathyarchaeia archaeon]